MSGFQGRGVRFAALGVLGSALLLAACGDDASATGTGGGGDSPGGSRLVFDLTADLATAEGFYAAPWPLDTRVTASGAPDWRGLPNPSVNVVVEQFKASTETNRGFSTLPVAYFRFDPPPAAMPYPTEGGGAATDPVVLVVIDETSPFRGERVPAVLRLLEEDAYTPPGVIAVAPRPGFVLRPSTTYGVALTVSNGVAASPLLGRLAVGAPEGEAEAALATRFAPLWSVLGQVGFGSGLAEGGSTLAEDLAAATVFTTGDVVKEMADLAPKVEAAHPTTIDDLFLRTEPEREHPDFCELRGTMTLPQFQEGEPPFVEKGLFVLDGDGVPVEQRSETVLVEIFIPRQPMPEGGYPLVLSIHGSGGFSDSSIAPLSDDGLQHFGLGPAVNFTHMGMGVATLAMPLNPERFEGASETEYLNPNNFAALRDTFRQGQLELHLFLESLRTLAIDPEVLAGCDGPELPDGETAFRFAEDDLAITGQSMGGMYANQIAATEPRVKVAAPTGAGGHWTYFILVTDLIENLGGIFQIVLGTSTELTFMHPALSLAAAGLEAADPIVFMPRIARRPLPGHPVRPIYQPVGLGDSYFPPEVFDAVALAYGHKQAGDVIWPEMQDALALAGLDGVLSFPVTDDLTSEDGTPYTGVVTQWEGDGEHDPHAIYVRREEVRFQYTCFFDSYFRTGQATAFTPERWEDVEACPE